MTASGTHFCGAEHMPGTDEENAVRAGVSDAKMRRRLVDLVFGGDESRYREFLRVLRESLPTREPTRLADHPLVTRAALGGTRSAGDTRWAS